MLQNHFIIVLSHTYRSTIISNYNNIIMGLTRSRLHYVSELFLLALSSSFIYVLI